MPTYDYHCETCQIDFEIEQAFSEDTLTKCPTKKSGKSPEGCAKSGRGKVTKVFSAPGITFRGTGFYKNDSRGGSSKSAGSDSGSSSSSSTESSSTSSSTDSPKKAETSSTAKSSTSKTSSSKSSD